MKKTITCKEAVDLVSRNEENLLDEVQKTSLRNHLEECPLCKTFEEQNRDMIRHFAETGDLFTGLNDEQKEEIVQRAIQSSGGH
jgi:uncharacterized membrane-anchored protein YhcB (DUF1043 family)